MNSGPAGGRGSRRPATPLSKQALIEAALAELNASGLDGLTLRSVAARLGVKAPALYWHVKNKQDLLDETATEIWRRISIEMSELPADLGWRPAMLHFARLVRTTLLSYRDGARTFSGTYMTDADVLRRQQRLIGRMTAPGFGVREVVTANSLLYSFVIGFCIEEQAVRQVSAAGDDRYAPDARVARVSTGGDEAAVAESTEAIFGDADQRFEEQVALILDAVERMHDRA